MRKTKTYQKKTLSFNTRKIQKSSYAARKYGWISVMGIVVLVVIGFLSQYAKVDPSRIHGVSGEGQFTLQSFVHGSTLELNWEEIPGIEGYSVYFSETNPLLEMDNSTELTTVGSTSLSLTPYLPGYYKVFTDGQPESLESNSLEVRKR